MNISTCYSVAAIELRDFRSIPTAGPVQGMQAVDYIATLELSLGSAAVVALSQSMRVADADIEKSHGMQRLIKLANRLVSGVVGSPMPCVDSVKQIFGAIFPQLSSINEHNKQPASSEAFLSLVELCCSLSARSDQPAVEAWISFSVCQKRLGLIFASYDDDGNLEYARFDEATDAFVDLFGVPVGVFKRPR